MSGCDTIATYGTGCAHSHSLLMATRFSKGVLNQSWTPGSVQVITVDGSWRPVLAGTPQSSRRYSDVQRRKEQTILSLPHSSSGIAGRQMFRIRFANGCGPFEMKALYYRLHLEVRHPARTGFVIDTIQTCATPQGNAGQRILPDTARRTAMFSTRAHHIFLQLSRAEELSTPRADGASRRRTLV